MGAIASQITSLTIVYSTIYSDAVQRTHQSSASLAFVRGIHRGPVNSPHKWPVTRKMFPFDNVIMCWWKVLPNTNSSITYQNYCTDWYNCGRLAHYGRMTSYGNRDLDQIRWGNSLLPDGPKLLLNQCWLNISKVLWPLPECHSQEIFKVSLRDILMCVCVCVKITN